jgi:uncharacterized membrane protein YpjA
MKPVMRRLGYGIIVWAVPYATSLTLLPLIQRDPIFFGTIMIVEGSIVGTMLAVAYFQTVPHPDVREGVLLGAVWMVENWLLDFAGVVPFTHTTIGRYFMEIGLRYVPMIVITSAIGYAWRKQATHA